MSFMVSTAGADVQVIAFAWGILVEIQNSGSSCLKPGHALARLSVRDATQLSRALNEAIAAAAVSDPRQTTLWPRASLC